MSTADEPTTLFRRLATSVSALCPPGVSAQKARAPTTSSGVHHAANRLAAFGWSRVVGHRISRRGIPKLILSTLPTSALAGAFTRTAQFAIAKALPTAPGMRASRASGFPISATKLPVPAKRRMSPSNRRFRNRCKWWETRTQLSFPTTSHCILNYIVCCDDTEYKVTELIFILNHREHAWSCSTLLAAPSLSGLVPVVPFKCCSPVPTTRYTLLHTREARDRLCVRTCVRITSCLLFNTKQQPQYRLGNHHPIMLQLPPQISILIHIITKNPIPMPLLQNVIHDKVVKLRMSLH
jgi:hypothetical protein